MTKKNRKISILGVNSATKFVVKTVSNGKMHGFGLFAKAKGGVFRKPQFLAFFRGQLKKLSRMHEKIHMIFRPPQINP